ncbi:MAG TPA: hypothetical protein VMD09_10135 [Solirubrobacteraceae bacterium]|nr:hypothetical protein [Solirubrobacteraceae bacterium]
MTIEEAKAAMVKLGAPLDIKPHAALLGLLRMTAGHVAYLYSEVGALEDVASPRARVLIDLYSIERDRLQKVAQACVGAGIAERFVRIEEAKVITLGQALSRASEAAGLTDKQRRRLGQALRDELRQLNAEAANDSEGDIWAADGFDAGQTINQEVAA